MQIIISPAKKMREDLDFMEPAALPAFLPETQQLLEKLQTFDRGELQKLFCANDRITEENYQRYQRMCLTQRLTPALLSYEGLQYQYMAPQIFTREQWAYVKEHLWILSGFYGILRPDMGVTPYRLEMQARLSIETAANLYEFWGNRLYQELVSGDRTILNLASREYARTITPYLEEDVRLITCVFGSWSAGKIKEKGTLAKMARGEMVRWLSLHQIEEPEQAKAFDGLGFRFQEQESTAARYVFVKAQEMKDCLC